ncbi:nucleotidyltransferase domain-containing protein [Quadrisphaera setariae]|uniref:nucleotidyltransferase domain-containing protein n=1 Tax=Quadrisphaera setariae TaxID=2593304 RepID=UPI0016508F8A|nr:nucleotidyltransferase domain-containing protein [Quadrisphaera setariae]
MRDPLEGVDGDGCIRTGADRSRVPAVYEPVLEALLAAFAPSAPSSLLLYGSVATGQARPPTSDVDVVVLGVPPAATEPVAQELSTRFADLCREVAVGAAQVEDHDGDDDEAHGNRVFLRHYCVLLAGEDVAADWRPFPADARAARGFNGDVALHLDRWRDAVRTRAGWDTPSSLLGRRLARKTLLAAAGLVSVHDSTWTTDRATGARRWGEVDTVVADDLRLLLAWADGDATASTTDILRVLAPGRPVQRVAEAFQAEIGLWSVS